ncbi:MAG: hypothetical protein BAJALOKI2v1_110072 [Promethearchaeota archaeon]|nr:MAG: hypothetical protein BAJALOKI2v1_110072 [Candidatus Lokiarchaeota archaeon]
MYLFKEQDEVEITQTCKLCLEEISFTVSANEYKATNKFPIKKENIHGKPKHKLIVYINQFLEIENFEIQDLIEEQEEIFVSEDVIKQALSDINLTDEEIDLYIKSIGRDVVSLGELSILTGKSQEECKAIADKFKDVGLFKEIVGATPHYSALPPYAALVRQLRDFYSYISELKQEIPREVDKSFSQFESEAEDVSKLKETDKFMQDLKKRMISEVEVQKGEFGEKIKVIDHIKDISSDIENLDDYTKNVMQDQIEKITQQFEDINSKTAQIIRSQVGDLKNELDNVKTTISENLQKLRLGVIQQTVEQVVDKVVTNRLKEITQGINTQISVNKMVFTDELQKVTKNLNTELLAKLRSSIEEALGQINGIEIKPGEERKELSKDMNHDFADAINVAQEKIEDISEGIFRSMGKLKEIFSERVVATIQKTLDDILKRLKINEITTEEFWKQARRVSSFTMKDIWFIRSPESARAHINEELSKAKLRVLIVAPQITDIDMDKIKEMPKHVNIRIAAHIEPSNEEHNDFIAELDQIHNVDYRSRMLQNLWGINRDYEEVVLCVLSETEVKGELRTEIAGIGSIIEEHIKIFVPILEDAWMSARKDIAIQVGNSQVETKSPPEPKEEKKVPEPKTREMEEPIVSPPSEQPERGEEKETDIPLEGLTPLQTQLVSIMNDLDSFKGSEIAARLEEFHQEYVKQKGYNSTIKNIHRNMLTLKNRDEILSKPERDELRMKMKFWRKKLEL